MQWEVIQHATGRSFMWGVITPFIETDQGDVTKDYMN